MLRPDNDASRDFYGHAVAGRGLLLGTAREHMPAAAGPFIAALNGTPKTVSKRGA